jgi:hypothetical protein
MTIFDDDLFRSADLGAFLRLLLGPLTSPAPVDSDDPRCDVCRDLSVDCDNLTNPTCSGCLETQLTLRGLVMNHCHECGGLLGVMPTPPGHQPTQPWHWHLTPMTGNEVPA